MMGWLILIGLALASGALLLLIGFPRHLWMIGATALTLGAAGYAFQGNPGLGGSPVVHVKKPVELDPELIALREAMFGRFNQSYAYFAISDAMLRTGSPDKAAMAMQGAVRQVPKDAALWTGLGMSLTDRDGGVVTPAARFAFDQAIALAPKHPGPLYFLGLALARTGELTEARGLWARAVALTPETLSYRPALVAQLKYLDGVIAERMPAQAQPGNRTTP